MKSSDSVKESLVFGLDIGTRAVVGVVGYREKDKFIVKAIESMEHDTRAMLDGQIHDIAKVANVVVQIKEKLEKKCKITLKNVCIAAAGRVLKTEKIHSEIVYDSDTVILDENIFDLQAKGIEEAYKKFQEENDSTIKYYCVGKSVMKYFLNDVFISNLLNHKAKKIAVDMICTFLPYEVVEGLYTAVEMAGLEVCNLTLEPIAAIEVAIPDKFRMLNIAMVDVGAGTSDICITKDGSVFAYGMIPQAGDYLTEIIANYCLVEFNEAEKIKKGIETNDVVEYEDILGLTNSITKQEVLDLLNPYIEEMTKQVSEEIIKLNDNNKVSAIFVVGGGGKIEGYTQSLAKHHDIVVNRVALRGEEVMGKIEFKDDSVTKDSLIVTPLGICLHFYEENNSFINVCLNDDRIKLYDNGKLTIVDAVMEIGLDNAALFPRRGDALVFTLNGEEKTINGELGEACIVYLNGDMTNLHAPLHANDYIHIEPSTKGAPGQTTLAKLNVNNAKLQIVVNGMNVTLPNYCTVNGEITVDSYSVQNGDVVEVLDYLTVAQVFELVDINLEPNQIVLVNNVEGDLDSKIYSRFEIKVEEKKEITYADLPEDDLEVVEEVVVEAETSDNNEETFEAEVIDETHDLTVIVNSKPVTLHNKSSYVFVDVFDHIDFDLRTPKGSGIATMLNGHSADFLEVLKDKDIIEIYWKE